MNNLEEKILSFDNWAKPWTFREFITNDKALNENELNLFNEIWAKASEAELWKNYDLVLGCKVSHRFISENYNLDNKAIANIVRALSYEWK